MCNNSTTPVPVIAELDKPMCPPVLPTLTAVTDTERRDGEGLWIAKTIQTPPGLPSPPRLKD